MIKRCLLLVFIAILGIQCSENFEEKFENKEIDFTPDIKKTGMDVAYEIRVQVKNMYQQKIFTRSHLENDEILKMKTVLNQDYGIQDLKTIAHRINSLTPIQRKILKQISEAKKESSSFDDFASKLESINDNILKNVPEVEQKRLLLVNSIIYYSYKEINALMSEGFLPRRTLLTIPRTKSRNEITGPTSGSLGDWCKEGLSTVWLAAAIEPTPVGEVVATGLTIIAGGVLLYEFLVYCFTSPGLSQKQCAELYADCLNKGGKLGGECYDCYRYCETQGVWNCY